MPSPVRSIAGLLQSIPLIVVVTVIGVIVVGNGQALRELEQAAVFVDRGPEGNILVLEFEHQAPRPASLDSVPSLQRLSVIDCEISSQLTREIGKLDELTALSFSGSRLAPIDSEILGRDSKLRDLDLSDTSETAGTLLAATLPELSSLKLNGCTWVDDETLAALHRFPGLAAVELSNTAVTNAGISHLKALPNLRWLNISHCNSIDESVLSAISQLSSLRSLTMSTENLSLASAREFQRAWPSIRMFTRLADFPEFQPVLAGDPILSTEPPLYVWTSVTQLNIHDDSGADYSVLRHFPELRTLSLSGPGIGDSTIAQLLNVQGIESLRLSGTQITDDALVHVAKLTRLRSLDLSRTQITDAGLRNLSGMTQLVWLDLSATNVTANGLTHIRALTSLVYLGLEGIELSNVGLEAVSRLPHLSGTLDLSAAGEFQIELSLLAGKPFESVDLTDRPVSDHSLKVVNSWTQLRSLRLSGTNVNGETLDLSANQNLSELYLDGTKILDWSLEQMALPPALRHVSFASTHISGETLPALQQLDLLSLDLSGAWLSPTGVVRAFALQPRSLNLKDVYVDADLSLIDTSGNRLSAVTLSANSPLLANLARSPVAKQLTILHLHEAESTQFPLLKSFPRLQVLTLSDCSLADATFRNLTELELLTAIRLDHCQLTKGAISELGLLQNLRSLVVTSEIGTLEGAGELLKSNPLLSIDYQASADEVPD